MSLNKLTNEDIGQELKLNIGCVKLKCEDIECKTIEVSAGGNIEASDLKVNGDLEVVGNATLKGNNYSTPDLGQNNYSLHTDGAGATFWAPDSTGDGDISYNGVLPTAEGQFVKFSSVGGALCRQSEIKDDGGNLNMASGDITNVGLVAGESIPSMRADISTNSSGLGNLQASQIIYTGVAPTTAGQLCVFNSVDGKEIKQDGVILTPSDMIVAPRNVLGANLDASGNVITDSILPRVSDYVQIDGCQIESKEVRCDTITEVSVGTGVLVDGVLIKAGLVDGVDVSELNSQVSSNSVDIGTLNSTKLDKDGSDDMTITNSSPVITLKDSLDIGVSDGSIQFLDAVDTVVGEINAGNGLTLDGKGSPVEVLDDLKLKKVEFPETFSAQIDGAGFLAELKLKHNGSDLMTVRQSGALICENDFTCRGNEVNLGINGVALEMIRQTPTFQETVIEHRTVGDQTIISGIPSNQSDYKIRNGSLNKDLLTVARDSSTITIGDAPSLTSYTLPQTKGSEDDILRLTGSDMVWSSALTENSATIIAMNKALQPLAGQLIPTSEVSYDYQSPEADAIKADQGPPIANPVDAGLGWYFTNSAPVPPKNKINWYLVGDTPTRVLGGLFAMTARVKIYNNTALSDLPYFTIYTKPQGAGDASSWYRSRQTWIVKGADQPLISNGDTILLVNGTDPINSDTDITHYITEKDPLTTVGPQLDDEEILTIAFSSDSNSLLDQTQIALINFTSSYDGITDLVNTNS